MKPKDLLGWSSALCLAALAAQAQPANEVEQLKRQLQQDGKSKRLRSSHVSKTRMPFFFNDAATSEVSILSLHDALPICLPPSAWRRWRPRRSKRTRWSS